MPKQKRGHHRTKRRTEPRGDMMKEGAIRLRYHGDKKAKWKPTPIENRIPLDGLEVE